MSYLDPVKLKKFTGKMVNIINNSMLGLMISIGHRTGLLETLSGIPPSKISEIAKKSSLNERYTQEWLNTMVVGGIVEYDSHEKLYSLPKEHAKIITRQAGFRNLALFAQWIGPLALVEDLIVDCFKNGGGVGYDNYPNYLKGLSEITNLKYDQLLLTKILPLIPGVPKQLENGVKVLDVGCGVGYSTNLMASYFPNSIIRGYDISNDGITIARKESERMGLTNVNFEVKNVEELDENNQYHLITAFDIIHDSAFPDKVLRSIANSLVEDGTFLMVDIKASSNVEDNIMHPFGPFLYSISTMHCMTVSLANGGVGLGAVWGRQKALEMLHQAGFKNVEVKELEEDVTNYYYIAKKY